MEGIYTGDYLKPLLPRIFSGPQKENDSANTECLIYSRHEQDSCKVNSNPNINELLVSDIDLFQHIYHCSGNSCLKDQTSLHAAVGNTVSTGLYSL